MIGENLSLLLIVIDSMPGCVFSTFCAFRLKGFMLAYLAQCFIANQVISPFQSNKYYFKIIQFIIPLLL